MARKYQNWYLRNWEYGEIAKNGKTVRKLVYTGEYYQLTVPPAFLKALKAAYAVLFFGMCAMYLIFETTLTQGGFVFYAGAPCLLAIIPLFYLGVGVACFVRTGRLMTYRDMRASYGRMRIGAFWSAVLLGLGSIGQTVFVLRYRTVLRITPELVMLFGALLCTLCAVLIRGLIRRFPAHEADRHDWPKPQ